MYVQKNIFRLIGLQCLQDNMVYTLYYILFVII